MLINRSDMKDMPAPMEADNQDLVQTCVKELSIDGALANNNSPQDTLRRIRDARSVRRKRITWGKSRLNKCLAELSKLFIFMRIK